jgi:hypothetical protein
LSNFSPFNNKNKSIGREGSLAPYLLMLILNSRFHGREDRSLSVFFNNGHGGLAARADHAPAAVVCVGHAGFDIKPVLRIVAEKQSSAAIGVGATGYGDSFDPLLHQIPPFRALLLFSGKKTRADVCVVCFMAYSFLLPVSPAAGRFGRGA